MWYGFGNVTNGFSDRSFMDSQATITLNDIDPRRIWGEGGITWGLNDDHNKYLIQAFLDNYGHRQICHESIFTWSRLLRGRYIAIRDKYDKLFATLDLIDDPFLTFREEEKEEKDRQETREGYSHDESRTDGNDISETSSTGRDKTENYGDEQEFSHDREKQVTQDKSESKTSTGQNISSTDYHLMTDTPQVGDGNAVMNGEAENATENGLAYTFNNGYLTDGKKDTHNERITSGTIQGSGASHVGNTEGQRRAGSNNYGHSEAISNNSSLANNTQQALTKANHNRTEGGAESEHRLRRRKGFEDESISALLTAYRETCIMLTGDFLAEFSDLFITIY